MKQAGKKPDADLRQLTANAYPSLTRAYHRSGVRKVISGDPNNSWDPDSILPASHQEGMVLIQCLGPA